MMVLRMRKAEKKRSDRSQSQLLLSLLPADPQTSTMRLWESLKWIQGKLKGLRRVLNRNSKTLKKNCDVETIPDLGTHGPGVSHGGFGRSSLQECLDRLNQAGLDAPAPCHSGVENEDSSNPPQFHSLLRRQSSLL